MAAPRRRGGNRRRRRGSVRPRARAVTGRHRAVADNDAADVRARRHSHGAVRTRRGNDRLRSELERRPCEDIRRARGHRGVEAARSPETATCSPCRRAETCSCRSDGGISRRGRRTVRSRGRGSSVRARGRCSSTCATPTSCPATASRSSGASTGCDQLEVPQGTVVFQTPGYISHVRVSPDGRRVGFLEHPLFGDNRGYVAVYDGKAVRRLTPEYSGTEALAWSADGREIWYGGANAEASWPIRAIDPDTTVPRHGRMVWYVPTNLLLHRHRLPRARSPDRQRGRRRRRRARAQVMRAIATCHGAAGRCPATCRVTAHTLLLSGQDGADPDYSVLLRRMDGSAPVKIGRGRAQALSPDGKWALSITPSEPNRVLLLPTGAGEPRQIDIGDLVPNAAVFVAHGSEGRRRRHPQRISGRGRRRRLVRHAQHASTSPSFGDGRSTCAGFRPTHTSPDGSLLAIQADNGKGAGAGRCRTAAPRASWRRSASTTSSSAGRPSPRASTSPHGADRRRASTRSTSAPAGARRSARSPWPIPPDC